MTSDEKTRVSNAAHTFLEMCPVIHNGDPNLTSVLETARKVRYDVIIIDYLQRIHDTGNEYDKTTKVTKELAKLTGKADGSRDYTPMVVALSQFNRIGGRAQIEEDRFPDITDLKGSSQVEQDADVILFLHRHKCQPKEDGRVYLKVAKNRGGPRDDIVTLHAQPQFAFIEEQPLSSAPEPDADEPRERYP